MTLALRHKNIDLKKTGYLFGAVLFTLLIALENTRFPFIILTMGAIFWVLLFIKTDLAFVFIFASFFVPVTLNLSGIYIKPADFILAITFLVLIVNFLMCGGRNFALFPYARILSLFIFIAILGLLKARSLSSSLIDIIQMVELYIIGGLLFANYLNQRTVKILAFIIVGGIAIQIIGVVPALIQGYRFWGWMGGSFPFYATFAGIIAYHFALYLDGQAKLLSIISFALIIIEMVACATRSGWLALAIGILLTNYIFNPKLLRKSLIVLIILVILLVGFGPALISSRLTSITDAGFYSNVSRLYLMYSAWNAFLSSPLIGVGIKNFYFQVESFLPENVRHLPAEHQKAIMHELEVGASAHNMYFSILGELGLLGFICMMLLIYQSLRDARFNLNKSDNSASKMKNSCILTCLVAFLVLAFFVPGIHVRIDYTIFFILLLTEISMEKRNYPSDSENLYLASQ